MIWCCAIFMKGESVMSDETITAEDKETPREGEGIPPLNLEDDEARPDSTARSSARSTLQRLDASLVYNVQLIVNMCTLNVLSDCTP